jgi:hypothetical protein
LRSVLRWFLGSIGRSCWSCESSRERWSASARRPLHSSTRLTAPAAYAGSGLPWTHRSPSGQCTSATASASGSTTSRARPGRRETRARSPRASDVASPGHPFRFGRPKRRPPLDERCADQGTGLRWAKPLRSFFEVQEVDYRAIDGCGLRKRMRVACLLPTCEEPSIGDLREVGRAGCARTRRCDHVGSGPSIAR